MHSNSRRNNPGKTFFILPKNEYTKKAWITAIFQKEGTLPKNVYLCSHHFEEAMRPKILGCALGYFCILPAQTQHNYIKTTLHKALF